MAIASIIISQPANSVPVGVAGRARQDLLLGQPVVLSNANDDDVLQWRWSLDDVPIGSTAVLSSPNLPQTQFVPDVAGTYLITLSLNAAGPGETQSRIAAVLDTNGYRYPATGETGPTANYDVGGEENEKGWGKAAEEIFRGSVTGESLAETLAVGNETDGNDIEVSDGDTIYFAESSGGTEGGIGYDHAAEELLLRADSATRVFVGPTEVYPGTDAATTHGRATERWLAGYYSGALYLAGGAAANAPAAGDDIVAGAGSGSVGGTIYTGSAGVGGWYFTDTGGGTYQGAVTYDHALDALGFYAAAAFRARLYSTGWHAETNNTLDLGLVATRWRTLYLGTSLISPLVNGGDFGTGTGAGTALIVRAGNGGTTGGAGAALDILGGSALAGNTAGGALNLRSGDSSGNVDSPNVVVGVGTSGTGLLGVFKLSNTAIELPEITAATDLATAPANVGRLSARDASGFTQPVWSVGTIDYDIPITCYQNLAAFGTDNILSGQASTLFRGGGLGYPTSNGEILQEDWVDITGGANTGDPPTNNGFTFGSITGEGLQLSIDTITADLDTTACFATDQWAWLLNTTGHGVIILAKIVIT